MKVLVEKCSGQAVWYKDKVGKVFSVESHEFEPQRFYKVAGSSISLFVSDCHIIEPLSKVFRQYEKDEESILQRWSESLNAWESLEGNCDTIGFNDILRVLPVEKPKFRAYSYKEALKAFKVWRWVSPFDEEEATTVTRITQKYVTISGHGDVNYEDLLIRFTHLGGKVCGIEND